MIIENGGKAQNEEGKSEKDSDSMNVRFGVA